MTSTAYPLPQRCTRALYAGLFSSLSLHRTILLFVSCHLQQTVYHGRVGEVTLLEAKSPGIGKRGNGDIEGTIGLPGDFHATSEDVGKECVGHNVLVAVDARNGRRVIERGQGTVETFEFRFYLRLQIWSH